MTFIYKIFSNVHLYFLYLVTALIFFDTFYTLIYKGLIHAPNLLFWWSVIYNANPIWTIFNVGYVCIILYKGRI